MNKAFTLIELMIVIAIIAIIAAIAIPNLLESRVTANESAASASLKSGIFAAQVQFQGSSYQDADADNVGEYGTLGCLAGKQATTKFAIVAATGETGIKTLQGPLATGAAAATSRSTSGFTFVSILPGIVTTATGALGAPVVEGASLATIAPTAGTEDCNAAERNFIVGCMPDKFGDTGRRVFVLTHDGQIRSPATTANLNAWYGGTAPTSGTAGTATLALAGCVHAITGTAAAPAAGLDLSVTTNLSANYPTFSK